MNLPLSVYVHWPFCKSKCPYCDFNSHVREGVDHDRWRLALQKELSYYAKKMHGRQVESIFFGGGTPSLMQPSTVAAIIDAVARLWPVSDNVEITLEANPTSVEAAKFKTLRSAGVNRVSLGVQALNAADLAFLGRQHNADEALGAVALASDIFPRMSFDLIYARPSQTLASWEKELTQALTYCRGHLSLYQLTIEENTAFYHRYARGEFIMPEESLAVELYQLTQEIMEAYDMPAYEISNHARAGEESRHNLTYWRGNEYIGIGPGAHGRVGDNKSWIATENIKSPERWLEKVEQSGNGLLTENVLSMRERMEEVVMMGLRLRDGINYADWYTRTGLNISEALNTKNVRELTMQSLITEDGKHIQATSEGRLLLNSITAKLLMPPDILFAFQELASLSIGLAVLTY